MALTITNVDQLKQAFAQARAAGTPGDATLTKGELDDIVKAAIDSPAFDPTMKKVLADEFEASTVNGPAQDAFRDYANALGLRLSAADNAAVAGATTSPLGTRMPNVVVGGMAAVPAVLDQAVSPAITGVMHGTVLTLADGSALNLQSAPWTGNSHNYRGLTDAVAFEGEQMTVRGWLGQSGALVVEEYAPGKSASFVQGGIESVNGEIGVRVRPDKWVKIASTKLAAQLANTEQQAIILHGPVTKTGDTWTFTGEPSGYWLIGGYFAPAVDAALGTTHNFQMHHGNNHRSKLADAALTPPSTGRVYAFGAFSDTARDAAGHGVLTISKFAAHDAGGFSGMSGPETGTATQDFLTKALGFAADP